MAYTKFHEDWQAGEAGGTPIVDEALDHFEDGISEAHRLAEEAADLATDPVALADIEGLEEALGGKAGTDHGHAIADVSGLQAELDAKAVGVPTIGEIDGLQGQLDGKADVGHGHAVVDIDGLEARLAAVEEFEARIAALENPEA